MRDGGRARVQREVFLIWAALLIVGLVSFSTSRYEFPYGGVLAIQDSLTLGGNPLMVYPSGAKLPQLGGIVQIHPSKQIYLLTSALDRILIRCGSSVPPELAGEPEAFSAWVKENCEFYPLWNP
jgi:hypothetical protein